MMYYIIYKTTNLINNKIYIGAHQTKNINDNYLGSGKLLIKAIKKYGRDSFSREILEFCETVTGLYDREREIVTRELIARSDTYNLIVGGKSVHRKSGHGWPDNARFLGKKTRDLKQTYRSESYRAIRSNIATKYNFGKAFLGKSHTEETKRKQSIKAALRIGEKNSQFGTFWITDGTDSKKCIDGIIPFGWYRGRKIKKKK